MASKSKEKDREHNRDMERRLSNIKEPTIIVKPISKLGGLDNIHVALIALVVVLILLLLVITYSKPPVAIRNETLSNCTYGAVNGSCVVPMHNASQIGGVAQRLLATYANTNSSLSVLAYVTNVLQMTELYVPGENAWLVTVPSVNPANNQTFHIAMLINDKNLSQVTPYYQLPAPSTISSNKVVAQGVIQVNQPACGIAGPLREWWFIDPYAPGGMQSLVQMAGIDSAYNGTINATLKILYSSYTADIGRQVGNSSAQALGRYLLCSTTQRNFKEYVSAVNALYSGGYLSPNTLQSAAQGAGLNTTALANCVSILNSGTDTIINEQSLLADHYNISFTPAVVTDCEYLSQPQGAIRAACYANSTFC